MPPQTMRQFLKPPEKAPDTLPRTQSTMSLLDYFSTVIQGLADPTGWTEPKAEDFDNPHAYTQALKAHGVGQLLGMAAPLAAPLAVMTRGARTAEAAAEAPQTLKAFHGSPHDFPAERLIQLPGGQQAYQLASEALPQGASVVKELPLGRFRGDKIGTGEGGQAYSYGHYLAQNPGVSETYKKVGPQGDLLTIRHGTTKLQGDAIDDIGLDAAKFLEMGAKDAGQFPHNKAYYAKKAADRAAEGLPGAAKRNEAVKARIDEWKDAKIGYEKNPGKMYEVNLHTSPESLLDWDKPLSQQPKKVQEALKKLNLGDISEAVAANKQDIQAAIDLHKRRLATPGISERMRYATEHDIAALEKQMATADELTGEHVYQRLVSAAGGRAGHTEGIASQQLADAGIHGVQYLDQGSRTRTTRWQAIHPQGGINDFPDEASARAFVSKYPEHSLQGPEPGTKNYVIFPHFEHLIEISKKYGISLPAAASLYKWQQSQKQQKGVE